MKKIIIFFVAIFLNTLSAQINVDNAPYNAVGDGTTDDSAAIQAAINDLRTTGGTLQFTSGKTYIISEGLRFNTFPATHNYLVTTTGIAKATIKLQDAAPLTWLHWGIRLSESRNITLENLIIDGNRDTRNPVGETSGTDVLFIDGASDGTRLKNLELINSPADNLYIVVHAGESPMTDFEMYNCKLDNGFRNNMSVISGSNFKIIACEFTNANGIAPEAGIDFEPNANSFPYNNILVEGCLFKGNADYGLMLTHIVDNTGSCIIKDNIFDNNGLLVASKNNSIHHNIFVNQDHWNDMGGDARDGIIYFHTDLTPTDNEVFNNYFYDNPMPANSHLVNFMYNSGGNNTVRDNYAFNNTVAGFVLNNTNPATTAQIITNNVFLNYREMGRWTMDNVDLVGTTMNDLSDFGHNGTITNATVIAGIAGEALDFSPDDKYMAIPANTNLDIEMNFTVIAWVNWNGVNASEAQQIIIGRADDWELGITNGGALRFYAPAPYTAGELVGGANSITANTWQQVVITYDGRNTKLYIDGVMQAAKQANGALGKTAATIYIGSKNQNLGSFNGQIDELRVYNYALEQTEIDTNFDTMAVASYSQDELLIYPNPVQDILHVNTALAFEKAYVYTLSGKLIKEITILNNEISVEHLPKGIYILKIINNNQVQLAKFIKK